MIQYACPYITKGDRKAVLEVLNSNQITQGKTIEKFEERICEYTGAEYAVAVSSCTAAVHTLCYFFKDIFRKNPVKTSPNSFVATTNAIRACNVEVSFEDITYRNYAVDKFIDVNVDFAGYYSKGGRIIDSAHSFSRNMPMNCHARALSFHAIKNITTAGEGGAIITNYPQIAEFARSFRAVGRKSELPWTFGLNYRMTHVQAAMGISQIKIADYKREIKLKLFYKYCKCLRGLPFFLPCYPKEQEHLHLFVIRMSLEEDRNRLKSFLFENNIETQINYWPIYKYLGLKADCPNMDKYSTTCLSLPFHEGMLKYQDYIIRCIKKFFCKEKPVKIIA